LSGLGPPCEAHFQKSTDNFDETKGIPKIRNPGIAGQKNERNNITNFSPIKEIKLGVVLYWDLLRLNNYTLKKKGLQFALTFQLILLHPSNGRVRIKKIFKRPR
jgi:hypothetical protein